MPVYHSQIWEISRGDTSLISAQALWPSFTWARGGRSEQRTIVVPDVEEFPGDIACSSESRSEIVVAVWQNGRITAVLDIDSNLLDTSDEIDAKYLEEIVSHFE